MRDNALRRLRTAIRVAMLCTLLMNLGRSIHAAGQPASHQGLEALKEAADKPKPQPKPAPKPRPCPKGSACPAD